MPNNKSRHNVDFLLEGESNPFSFFTRWFEEAQEKEINDPNAMALATVDTKGRISSRMVLLKGYDSAGFVFYTNLKSDKGKALEGNPQAALLFHWKSLRRQVRIEGPVERVDEKEADAYFKTRPRASQTGAWVSKQSARMKTRMNFMAEMATQTARWGMKEIIRPPHWSGFRVKPIRMEFWQDGKFRLHDRVMLTRRSATSTKWQRRRLYP